LSEKKRKSRKIIIIITALIITLAIAVEIQVGFFRRIGFDPVEPADIPGQITVTIAWNPGSIADDMIRVMDFGETQLVLQNIPGTHGAKGLNAVFGQEHDGTNLLSTSLSAFIEVGEMGFAESRTSEWTEWIVAYSSEYDDYYGLFVPANVPEDRLRGLDSIIGAAVLSDGFIDFLKKNGLAAVTPERGRHLSKIK